MDKTYGTGAAIRMNQLDEGRPRGSGYNDGRRMKKAQTDPGRYTSPPEARSQWVTRRDFLVASTAVVAGVAVAAPQVHADPPERKTILRFGMAADAHFADVEARGTRHYRESAAKMAECVALMNEQKVDFLIELGDLKDQGEPASEQDTLEYLDTIEGVFRQFKGPRYHVLGNHDMDSLSKEQFLSGTENTGIAAGSTYYSFDVKGVHFVVLDANYSADGSDYDHGQFNWTDANIPAKQLDWLKRDLEASSSPTIVFVHQQLDGEGQHCIRNAAEVREVLQASGQVRAVFQGHNHAGGYRQIHDLHYYTLKAMVEGTGSMNSSYAIAEVRDDGIVVTGYCNATSRELGSA